MQHDFSSDFFVGNRGRLREQLKESPIVITANGQLQASSDNPFPFQQDTGFWYLTGIDQPDYILVMYKDSSYVIAPTRSEVQNLFDGAADQDSVKAISGIDEVLGPTEGWARLKDNMRNSRRVYTLQANPSYIAVYGMYTNPARSLLIRRLKHMTPNIEVADARSALAKLRVVKQTPEIAAIRAAVDINCATINDVQRGDYTYEYEMEADISRGFRMRGARGHAFSPIVASGLNACTFHYEENGARLEQSDLVLADTGVRYGQYSSDITRTWSLSKPSDRQSAVYNAVNEALEFGIAQLKPGPSFYECEQKVREFVGEKLKELGLLKHIDKDGIYKYYPHAPHYLGLDTHDVGDTRQPLVPGMVMTLEPGIYVPDDRIGVRLEEDLLITENGCEVLSKACPRALTSVQ